MPPKMEGTSPTSNLDKEEIDLQKLQEYHKSFVELTDKRDEDGLPIGVISLESLPLQYRRAMALSFIKEGTPGYVIEYLQKYNFDTATEKEIALKVIEIGGLINVAERIRNFKRMDREVALKLVEGGEGYNVISNIDYIEGVDVEEVCKLFFSGKNPKAEESAKAKLGKDWLDEHWITW